MNRILLEEKPYSVNVNDRHLSIRLYIVDLGKESQEFVVWTYDKIKDSTFWGHYLKKITDAVKCFNELGIQEEVNNAKVNHNYI